MKYLNINIIFLLLISTIIFVYKNQSYKKYQKVTGVVKELEDRKKKRKFHDKTTNGVSVTVGSVKYTKGAPQKGGFFAPTIVFETTDSKEIKYIPVLHSGQWKLNEKVELLYNPYKAESEVVINKFYSKYPIVSILLLCSIIYSLFRIRSSRKPKRQKSKFAESNI